MAREFARLEISTTRRVLGAGIQGGLGLVLIWVAATRLTGSMGWRGFLVILGGALLWGAWRFWQSSGVALILTRHGLADSTGRQIFTLDQVDKVDRGLFAFKPASGFLVISKTPVQRGWVPGLWWAIGHRIGVGGATARPAGKQMADILSVLLTERGAEIIAQDEP